MSKRLKNTLFILSVILVLGFSGACSLRSTALKFSDSLILFQIDKMFDLTEEQEQYLEPKIEKFVNWLKVEKSNNVISSLEALRKNLKDGLNKEEYLQVRRSFKAVLVESKQFLKSDFLWLMKSLSDEQLKHFSNFLSETNEDIEERLGSNDFESDQLEKIKERTERIYGELTSGQDKELLKLVRSKKDLEAYLTQREVSQRFVLEKIRIGRQYPELHTEVFEALISSPENLRPKEYIEEYLIMSKHWNTIWVETDKIMNDSQRKHAQSFVSDLIADLLDWSKV